MIRAHPSEWAVLVGDRNIPHSRRRGADIHGRPSQGRDRHESPTSQATERRTAPGVTPLPRVRIMGCRVHHLRQTRAKPHPSQSGTQLSRGLLGLEMGYRVGARGDHVPERRGSAEVRSRRTLPTTPDHLFEVAAVAERPSGSAKRCVSSTLTVDDELTHFRAGLPLLSQSSRQARKPLYFVTSM